MKQTLYALALGVFGITTTEFGVIGIAPQIASAFNVTIEKTGWLLSAFALIVAIFGPFLMIFLSSFNRKKLMLIILGIFTVSNILSVFASNFNILLLARILPAFFHPVFWSIALSTAANSTTPEKSPKAIGVVFGGFTIASVLGIPLATLVTDIFNWQSSFILFAFINLLSLIGVLLFLPATQSLQKLSFKSQLQILKKRQLWISFILSFLMIAAMYSTYGYISAYLDKITRIDGKQISLMLFIFGTAGIIGNFLASKFLSRSISVTIIVFILLLITTHLLLYFFGIYFLPMIVLIALWGLVHASGFLISNINLTTSASEAPEFVNTIFTTCGNLAVTAGTLIGGFWITNFDLKNVIWSSVILLIFSSLAWLIKYYFVDANNR
jgi:predicted MFS family arabinose efflux permease